MSRDYHSYTTVYAYIRQDSDNFWKRVKRSLETKLTRDRFRVLSDECTFFKEKTTDVGLKLRFRLVKRDDKSVGSENPTFIIIFRNFE